MRDDINNENSNVRVFGKWRLDIGKKFLWCEEKPVPLPLKSIELLCLLVEGGGEVVTKDEIWKTVWKDAFVEETNLTHNIYLLRKTFKDLGEKNLIQTVPSRGYRFAGEIREIGNGKLVIEKHTQTRTLIEIQEEVENDRTGEDENWRTEVVEKKTLLHQVFSFYPFTLSSLLPFSFVVALVGAIGFFGYQSWQRKTSALPIKSIAVLPFKTIDGGKENEYQGLGLADVLITRLSNIKEINVKIYHIMPNNNFMSKIPIMIKMVSKVGEM